MFSKVISGAVCGVEGILINVEADVNDGLPIFNMVGFLASEVREAHERVRTALRNSGYSMPPKRITVNLSPADIRKEGSAFDLPIAISILVSMGYIPKENVENIFIAGELSLNGQVNKVSGILPMVDYGKKQGIETFIVPKINAMEGAVVKGVRVIGVESLIETIEYLNNNELLEETYVDIEELYKNANSVQLGDFSDIHGQKLLKRAMEVAVAGMHNIIMIGPPGGGKSMIAKRVPTIMPPLNFEESIEITKIYSVKSMLREGEGLIVNRPFRAPHHTISTYALAGGGNVPKPGEISLAHNGVLFLDELAEFSKNAIEAMRQPLEDCKVMISRVNGTYSFPADFMLLAATNPCPCGQYPDMNRCTCSVKQIRNYQNKISQAVLDRIDINIEVEKVKYNEITKSNIEETSKTIRGRIINAHNIQKERYKEDKIFFNSQLSSKAVEKYCYLGKNEEELIKQAYEKYSLSARGYHRILRVARTIADLGNSEHIKSEHLCEAITYRNIKN